MNSSIAMLAGVVGVSEPTVNRFCHRLGTRCFPDFKLQLAQSLVQNNNWVNRGVEDDDSVENYSQKIFDSALAELQRVRDQLNSVHL